MGIAGVVIHRERGPKAVRRSREREPERPRHHSYDCVDFATEAHSATHDRFVAAELRVPKGMADQNDPRPCLFFVRRKSAAEFWLYAERGKKIPGHNLTLQLHCAIESSQRETTVVIRDQVLECVI